MAVEGEGRVTGLVVKNVRTGKEETLACAGVFAFVGSVPDTQLLDGIAEGKCVRYARIFLKGDHYVAYKHFIHIVRAPVQTVRRHRHVPPTASEAGT